MLQHGPEDDGVRLRVNIVLVGLIRVLTNAKTHITGTPQKFDPMEMMRRRRDNQ